MKNIYIRIILSAIIFGVSLAAYYYPIYKKGYTPGGAFSNLSEARNFALSGTYRYESSDGMFLSSDRAFQEGRITAIPNPLTPIIYGQIFKITGADRTNLLLPMHISIVLATLFNVAMFLLIARLFNTIAGFSASMIMALMPVRISGVLYFGSYEFAMIFFTIALWFYFGSKRGPFSASPVRLSLAGALFALTALARNAFLISFAPFVLYDFYKNRSFKRSLIFILPFLIIFGSTLTPYSWLGTPNGYTAGIDSQPFGQLGHIFRDPYSAFYNRDSFIKEIEDAGSLDRTETHFLKQWGYNVSWPEQLGAYKESAAFYVMETVDLINLGGPMVVLFMLAGFYWLYRNKKDIFWFFCVWMVIWFSGLVYFETANWDHFLEIILITASLAGLGFYQLWQWISSGLAVNSRTHHYGLGAIILLALFVHLAYADKWRLFDDYRSSPMGKIMELTDKINKNDVKGVVAVGIHPVLADGVYYFTNRDIVYFGPVTVEKLIQNKRLKEVFNIYGVKVVAGYSADLTEQIKREIKVTGLTIE